MQWSDIDLSTAGAPRVTVPRDYNAAADLIAVIARHAQQQADALYLVGGVVRDLLLKRPNLDMDFVVEHDAIAFASSLRDTFGGEISPYAPFRTAKWRLTEAIAQQLGFNKDDLPEHVDFATARYEFYTHPTALPTVYNSSIKLDLHRRDFTINTLAVQLSPAALHGRLLDFYGGLDDLKAGRIRVLHSLSFIDDPTRILRAVRFEQRLGFHIEPRTAELITTAFPMLKRITGERLRNELNLLIREARPEKGLLALQARGILKAIHPAFVVDPQVDAHFERVRDPATAWPAPISDRLALYWHIALSVVPANDLAGLCERLLINKQTAHSLVDAASLRQQPGEAGIAGALPSQVTTRLETHSELALLAVWLVTESTTLHNHITHYLTAWRHITPVLDGNALRAMGLPPGPQYGHILNQLRAGRLDGTLNSDDDERALAEELIREARHDSP
ncbi:CCA tRNA nucleotidyltransferase [bacterium]|nr:CCA tRNA nucleotidyltransferase [bacterium]